MNTNQSLVADALLQISQIKADFNAGKAFSSNDNGASFESVLDQKLNTEPYKPEENTAVRQEKKTQDKRNETASEQTRKEDRKIENDKPDTETVSKTEDNRETEQANPNEETASREKEKNSSEKQQTSSDSNKDAVREQAKTEPGVAVAKQLELAKLTNRKESQINPEESSNQAAKEKIVRYTDSKGNSRILRLNVSNSDIEKLNQRTQRAAEAAAMVRNNAASATENKTDVVLNSRQFEDDNTLKKLSQLQADNQGKDAVVDNAKKTDSNKGKLVSISDLLGRQNRVNPAMDQNMEADLKNQANLLNRQNGDVFKFENLMSKVGNRFGNAELGNTVPFETALERIKSTSGPQIRSVEARQQIINQFLDAARVQLSRDNSKMNIQLKPDYLGEINMKLQIQSAGANKGQTLVGVIEVESNAVKEVLQNSFSQLRQNLEDQNGLSVKKFEIIVKHDMPDQQKEQQEQHAQNNQKQRAFRFINTAYLQESDTGSPSAWDPQERLVVNGYSWTA